MENTFQYRRFSIHLQDKGPLDWPIYRSGFALYSIEVQTQNFLMLVLR